MLGFGCGWGLGVLGCFVGWGGFRGCHRVVGLGCSAVGACVLLL